MLDKRHIVTGKMTDGISGKTPGIQLCEIIIISKSHS